MRRPLRTAWRCEFTVDGLLVRAEHAATPPQALIWMRVSVRTLLSAFDAEDRDRTFRWLDHGQWEAVIRLRAGESYTYTVRAGGRVVGWSARPVRVLPVATVIAVSCRWTPPATPQPTSRPRPSRTPAPALPRHVHPSANPLRGCRSTEPTPGFSRCPRERVILVYPPRTGRCWLIVDLLIAPAMPGLIERSVRTVVQIAGSP